MNDEAKQRKAIEGAIAAGVKAGWTAACREIAHAMRTGNAPDESVLWVEALAAQCPEVTPVRMLPGETLEQAIARDQAQEKILQRHPIRERGEGVSVPATCSTCPWWVRERHQVSGEKPDGECRGARGGHHAEDWWCSEHPDRRLPEPPPSLHQLAAMAMQGLCADPNFQTLNVPVTAYDCATAMLAERERREKEPAKLGDCAYCGGPILERPREGETHTHTCERVCRAPLHAHLTTVEAARCPPPGGWTLKP